MTPGRIDGIITPARMSRQLSIATVKRLYAASGGMCAFPGCPTKLVDTDTGALLGELCHIHAASPGGPRYEPTQTDSARGDVDNLVILCPTHHSLVDQAPDTYTAGTLRAMKAQHENAVATRLAPQTPPLGEQGAVDFARQVAEESIDFAIVVGLRKELESLLSAFPELKPVTPLHASPRSYYAGTIPATGGGYYRVVATLLPAIGNLEASHATADLLHEWKPRFVIVNGIAGGLARKSQEFGDIVVSDAIVYYELAKYTSTGPETRWRQFPSDRTLVAGILNVHAFQWRFGLPPRPDGKSPSSDLPAVHVGPIASGEKVIAAAEEAQRLRSVHANLIAIEMESAGVASAAFSALKKVGFITIRALCDFADASKSDNWHAYAAAAASSFLRAFLESRPVAFSEGRWPHEVASVVPRPKQTTAERRKQLFDRLCMAMDQEEFKNFCFLLAVDIDELPGDRKSAKVRELILLFERRGQIATLEEAVGALSRGDGA